MATYDPQVVEYFIGAVNSWSNNSLQIARQNFEWCLELDHSAVDALRALAATEDNGNGVATDDQIEGMWRYRAEHGALLRAGGGDPLLINGKYDTGMWEVEQKLCTKSDIALAYACLLIKRREWDGALKALKEADAQVPFTTVVRAFVYYSTKRWGDVLRNCEQVSNAQARYHTDVVINPPEPDYTVQGLASLMAGEALCRLEKPEAAVARLEIATGVTNPVVAARACFLTGMAYRAMVDEPRASAALSRALASHSTAEYIKAESDPSFRLSTTTVELIDQRTSYWDASTEPLLTDQRASDSERDRERLLKEADEELGAFIGMEGVKRQVRKLKAVELSNRAKEQRGIEVPVRSHHILFTGPPGTGKTTVARVIGKMYAGLGIVERPDVLETSRPDFVGDTVGSTGIKTKKIIEKAMDGVLFIDEAYALVQEVGHGQKDAFGQEALDVLVAEMENNRDRLVVIAAGYNRDIERLLATNEGLKSRFSRKVEFHSYSPDEIWEIAESMAAQRRDVLGEGVEELIKSTVSGILLTSNHEGKTLLDIAGNGRFVRNVIQSAEEERELRLLELTENGTSLDSLTDDELMTCSVEDVKIALDALVAEYL